MIDDNNYELWLLRYAEGELSVAEREAVEAWLARNPEAAEELALYGEAPKPERDESIRYAAVPQQHPRPLWPAALRWSAAAAVVLALMVPALRMGTMDTQKATEAVAAPLFADARPTEEAPQNPIKISRTSRLSGISRIARTTNESSISRESSIASLSGDTISPIPSDEIIETTTLIVFEDSPAEAAPVETESLIAYDRSMDWSDALLAVNDAFNENRVTHQLVSNLINRLK